MPQHGRGKFHAPTVVQWLVSRGKTEQATEITDQRTQLYRAQTQRTELENAQLRGTLLDAEAVQVAVFDLANMVATHLDAVEPRIAPMIPADVRPSLHSELTAVREAIASGVETFANTRDSGRDHPTAA